MDLRLITFMFEILKITRISFHSNRTTYSVKEGDVVNYRLEMGPMGWHAVDIAKKP